MREGGRDSRITEISWRGAEMALPFSERGNTQPEITDLERDPSGASGGGCVGSRSLGRWCTVVKAIGLDGIKKGIPIQFYSAPRVQCVFKSKPLKYNILSERYKISSI